MMRRLSLVTVCEEARCPNIHECWARERTATFMLMGDICTRTCGFCAVAQGAPGRLDPEEPERVAKAAAELGLSHAVVTSVNRDDLDDGGAAHFAATIRAIRDAVPGCTVEVLIPDFRGDEAALETVLEAEPEVLNHNTETVPRLYRRVRPQARYAQSLELLARADACRRDESGTPVPALGHENQERPDRRASERRRKKSWRRSRTCGPPAATSSRSGSTCSRTSAGCRSRSTTRRRSSTNSAAKEKRWVLPESNRGRSSGRRTTRGGPSNEPGKGKRETGNEEPRLRSFSVSRFPFSGPGLLPGPGGCGGAEHRGAARQAAQARLSRRAQQGIAGRATST